MKVRLPADEEQDSPLQVWEELKTLLSAGDIEGALQHFSSTTREAYREVLAGTGDQMDVVVQDMGELLPLAVMGPRAVYGVLRYDDDKPYLFEVTFVKEGPQEWKILNW